jgi:ArsR family transcriptional regulator
MERMVKIFSALSDTTRLRIYLLLLEGELCVCELVGILDMEQSRISHSLRILREVGLINNERKGKWIVYSVNPEVVKSEIIQGLKKEAMLTAADRRKIVKCKGESIREKCRVG